MSSIESSYVFCIFIASFLFSIGAPSVVPAEELTKRMESIVRVHESKIQQWLDSEVLLAALEKQNTTPMSLEAIKDIDNAWVAGNAEELVADLQNNEAGRFLRQKIKSNSVIYVEAFLCDKQGAVVAEYPKTSDYWQGDEDKFIKCFNDGNGRVYRGPMSFDESTGTHSVQLSLPVVDKGETVGVLVVGLVNIK